VESEHEAVRAVLSFRMECHGNPALVLIGQGYEVAAVI